MAKDKETPMMAQYHQIKAQYPDAFLFYRLGDFYELFEEDALRGAKILELTLTSRNKNAENPIPMAGIPYHAANNYIEILVDQGYKVAIVEQMEDPASAKGMVQRDVVQLITPGTKLAEQKGDGKENNYLAAVLPMLADQAALGADWTALLSEQPEQGASAGYALAYIDLSTGELKTTRLADTATVIDELRLLEVKEVVLAKQRLADTQDGLAEALGQRGLVVSLQGAVTPSATITYLIKGLKDLAGQAVTALLLQYLFDTQKRSLDHIMPVQSYERQAFLLFNQVTRVNLDLVENARTKQKAGSLFALLDETKTAMGGRLLKQWLLKPLKEQAAISRRQAAVAAFKDAFFTRSAVQEQLKQVYDLERLAGKAALGSLNARDLIQLKRSLQAVPVLQDALMDAENGQLLQTMGQALDPLADLADLIAQAIVADPPISLRDGDLIQPGFDELVDRYQQALADNQTWLANYQQAEREATGISGLKVKYNKNFGYFIEITKANLSKLSADRYQRKQTLTNAERFTTSELKEHEDLIFAAQTKRFDREYELFLELRQSVKEEIQRLQGLAHALARLDVLAALADVAESQHFVQPQFHHNQDRSVAIRQGRHPVIEALLGPGEYVANDIFFDENTKIQLVTGPNMAGKSTYMRQLALIIILAQMGSFVPADEATLPIYDQIFTRIGANDDLVNGRSTFMVEMAEANTALQQATAQSLILFDELGRGTATYDGMALAQAIIEYLDEHLQATTVFATHYHELTALADVRSSIENVHVGAQLTNDGRLHFLHQVQPGAADRSYGIQVAALAGLPQVLLDQAERHLADFEQAGSTPVLQPTETEPAPTALHEDLPLFVVEEQATSPRLDPTDQKLLDQIDQLDLNQMTPLAALNTLMNLQQMRQQNGENS
ncbi:DNA mismatch repair protein MutS [Leuconostocaceae bacterium ESL0958]|nr:DNA mismatch repair protein MutS [Leuconostocaceae bacterium ESL0958]